METEWMNETSAEAPSVPAPEKTEKKKFSLKGFGGKKKKRWLKILIILVVVIAIVAGCVSRLTKNVNTQLSSSYLVSTVTRQDLTVSVSGTATLQPADSYNVTTLLSGDIVSAPFEEGDLVTKDTLLYTMDSSDAQDSMDRAQISVQQAQMSYQQAQEALHPTAPISGTVSEIYVHNGESVTAGTQLAKIVASTELSIDFLFPFASPSDFYVGQAATVFVDGYAGSQMGTVTYVSNSTTITSNGKEAVSVRVRLNNPGTVSDAVTASAIIGSYSSYGQAPVSMPASSVVYASGSGKSTAMNIIGCLDVPTSGTYHLGGIDVSTMEDDQQAEIRNKMLGFIFQQYNLIPKLTVQENVELPLLYAGVSAEERRERAIQSLERVGLADKRKNLPSQLSGGQQQRVSIARALAGNPSVILADEPTGALDSRTGREVLRFLQKLNQEGDTVVLITHDNSIAVKAKRIVRLQDGRIIYDGDASDPQAVVQPQEDAGEGEPA